MNTEFKFNTTKNYLNKLDGRDNKFKQLVENYKYFIPQFYIKKDDYIKNFHEINLNLSLFNKYYDELKEIMELNKKYLKLPSDSLLLDFDKDNNIIYQNLDFNRASDYNYLLNNKKIFKNLKEYKSLQTIYTNIKTNIFTKILNSKLKNTEKKIFFKLYSLMSKYSKLVLKYDFSIGVLGYNPIFNIHSESNKVNNTNNNNKYVLMNNKYAINNTSKSNNNNESTNNGSVNNEQLSNKNKLVMKRNILNDTIINYTDLYNPYDYNKIINEKKKDIENFCVKFHNVSLQLSQKSYTNIFDLLNLILDQEYYLVNFIINFNDIKVFKKILQQDNIIRKYIKRNIVNFSSYMDQYKALTSSSNKDNLFSIPSYDIKEFFKNNN